MSFFMSLVNINQTKNIRKICKKLGFSLEQILQCIYAKHMSVLFIKVI